MQPRRPWGLQTATLPQRSRVPKRPTGAVSCRPERGPPSLGAANSENVATFVGSWRPSGVVSYADKKQNEASPSLRAANCETVTTFEGAREAQRSDFIRKLE